jgi:hypothetical protein
MVKALGAGAAGGCRVLMGAWPYQSPGNHRSPARVWRSRRLLHTLRRRPMIDLRGFAAISAVSGNRMRKGDAGGFVLPTLWRTNARRGAQAFGCRPSWSRISCARCGVR